MTLREEYNNKVIEAKKLIKQINASCEDLIREDLSIMDVIVKEKNIDDIYDDLKELMIEIVQFRVLIDFEEAKPRKKKNE